MSTQRHSPDCEVIIRTELPPLPAEGRARLRKLIAFLRQLPREKFNFREIVAETSGECGTVGCAIGWCPAVFPNLARWQRDPYNKSDMLVYTDNAKDGWYEEVAKDLFGVSEFHARNLFCPNNQRNTHEGLHECGNRATPTEVADMLEHFVQLTETPVLT